MGKFWKMLLRFNLIFLIVPGFAAFAGEFDLLFQGVTGIADINNTEVFLNQIRHMFVYTKTNLNDSNRFFVSTVNESGYDVYEAQLKVIYKKADDILTTLRNSKDEKTKEQCLEKFYQLKKLWRETRKYQESYIDEGEQILLQEARQIFLRELHSSQYLNITEVELDAAKLQLQDYLALHPKILTKGHWDTTIKLLAVCAAKHFNYFRTPIRYRYDLQYGLFTIYLPVILAAISDISMFNSTIFKAFYSFPHPFATAVADTALFAAGSLIFSFQASAIMVFVEYVRETSASRSFVEAAEGEYFFGFSQQILDPKLHDALVTEKMIKRSLPGELMKGCADQFLEVPL